MLVGIGWAQTRQQSAGVIEDHSGGDGVPVFSAGCSDISTVGRRPQWWTFQHPPCVASTDPETISLKIENKFRECASASST